MATSEGSGVRFPCSNFGSVNLRSYLHSLYFSSFLYMQINVKHLEQCLIHNICSVLLVILMHSFCWGCRQLTYQKEPPWKTDVLLAPHSFQGLEVSGRLISPIGWYLHILQGSEALCSSGISPTISSALCSQMNSCVLCLYLFFCS